MSIAEALLDQRALAGIGNIWKNETLWIERVSPFVAVGELDDATLDAARRHRAPAPARQRGADGARVGPRSVYGRSGRPCRRCGTPDRQRPAGDRDPAHDLLVPDLPADADAEP